MDEIPAEFRVTEFRDKLGRNSGIIFRRNSAEFRSAEFRWTPYLQLIDCTEGSTAHRKGGRGTPKGREGAPRKGGRGTQKGGEGHTERGGWGCRQKGGGTRQNGGRGHPKMGGRVVYFSTISFLGRSTVFNRMGLRIFFFLDLHFLTSRGV